MSPSLSNGTARLVALHNNNETTTKHTMPQTLSPRRTIGTLLSCFASSAEMPKLVACAGGSLCEARSSCQAISATGGRRPAHRWRWSACATVLLCATAAAQPSGRLGDVVRITGSDLAAFNGVAIERVGVLACASDACRPIPFQVDERDAEGRWVLDQGPEPTQDEPPGLIDDNDVLLFNAEDAGDRAARR